LSSMTSVIALFLQYLMARTIVVEVYFLPIKNDFKYLSLHYQPCFPLLVAKEALLLFINSAKMKVLYHKLNDETVKVMKKLPINGDRDTAANIS